PLEGVIRTSAQGGTRRERGPLRAGASPAAGALWLGAQFPARLEGVIRTSAQGGTRRERGPLRAGASPAAGALWLGAQFPAPLRA
ncbi:hypothetical protein ACIGW1_22745, partial [Streptomyces sp. NPDC053780]|uniref:hypothetical protein n=1 Tax=Streptomyces sp. NPDC053780 TaxID=3365715 RepID=UPI0037D0F880